MVKLGEPPAVAVLAAVPPHIRELPAGQELVRIYFQGGAHPTAWHAFRYYGPASTRFDHHLPPPSLQARGVCYAALDAVTCAAEVFQRRRVINRFRSEPWLVGLLLAAPLRLLDLTDWWPTRAGASMALTSHPDHARTRRWAQAIYVAYPDLDGLWYGSCMHGNRPAVALFERADGRFEPEPLYHRALADPLLAGKWRHAASFLGWPLI